MHAESAVVDGELVAVDANGRPSFQALQHRAAHPRHVVVFYAFDLLHINGKDLTARPLTDRRALLPGVIGKSGILLSQELPGSADEVRAAVAQLGLEGVIAKRRESRYDAGQRWYYFPDLIADELIVWKAFDSDPARDAQPLHNSADIPGLPEDTAPRVSIEARFFAFFE